MSPESPSAQAPRKSTGGARDQNSIYQEERLVGRVVDPQIDVEGKRIAFDEIHNSDELVLADECEFQKYLVIVRKVGYASKVSKEEPHKGRILRQVVAEIRGYREQ